MDFYVNLLEIIDYGCFCSPAIIVLLFMYQAQCPKAICSLPLVTV